MSIGETNHTPYGGDDLIKRDDAPKQIFASQGDDGWRWPRASKFPEQGPYENIMYVRADLLAKAMEALREIYCDGYAIGLNPQWLVNAAGKVLAELEGKDE